MRQYDTSSLTSCLPLSSEPTDLTAFRVTVFQSDQLRIEEEQNGRTMFTRGAGKKGRLRQPGCRDLPGTMSLQICVPYVKLD